MPWKICKNVSAVPPSQADGRHVVGTSKPARCQCAGYREKTPGTADAGSGKPARALECCLPDSTLAGRHIDPQCSIRCALGQTAAGGPPPCRGATEARLAG